jgi:adenosylcobinamide amidohydrolase
MVSSAPYGGGLGVRRWVINAQVPSSYGRRDPAHHLGKLAVSLGLAGKGTGMLTAADVRAFSTAEDGGASVTATVGLGLPILAAATDNADGPARANSRDGSDSANTVDPDFTDDTDDTADTGDTDESAGRAGGKGSAGTINILVVLPERLADAALVNAVATATEAKVQALRDLGLHATGTATDAVCVACPDEGRAGAFGGPRSVWGARLARAVHAAVLTGGQSR